MQTFIHEMERAGPAAPWLFLLLFIAASVLMIWRLEAMSANGFEGTVLGTLLMPYCTGIGNLVLAFLLGSKGGPGAAVITNSLVNNLTNLTLILGLPALIWGLRLKPKAVEGDKKKKSKGGDEGDTSHEINRLSLLLTLTAVLFFTGAAWALGRDGKLTFNDGLVLVGLFCFWQCFHVFDVLKKNVSQSRSFSWMLPLNLLLLAAGAYAIYLSVDWLVAWLMKGRSGAGFVSAKNLGWLSGWMMVLPNALLALYYGWRGRPEATYASQVGDGHICIPLCLGIYALYRPLNLPAIFEPAIIVLLAATGVHLFFVALFGQLPRLAGAGLILGYGWILFRALPL